MSVWTVHEEPGERREGGRQERSRGQVEKEREKRGLNMVGKAAGWSASKEGGGGDRRAKRG